MSGLRRHPLRVIGRLLWLAGELSVAALNYLRVVAFRANGVTAARAAWLHQTARRMVLVLGVECRVAGPVPERGLLVCNHLSYVDIPLLGALTPAVFVAKREVKSWPVFGWFASRAGTVFIDRERRSHVGAVSAAMAALLGQNFLVVVFPEGTSSGGQTVLPFKSALLEPAANQTCPLSVALIQYELADGDVAEEICYWKDMTFAPHLLNLLGQRAIRATVRFAPWHGDRADRKELARQLHAEVMRLRETPVPVGSS